ncbi:MAG: GumC family protein [Isosphaeraceae bacterium]
MDGIMPLRANPASSANPNHHLPAVAGPGSSTNLAAIKTPAHYVKAVRRRLWLVLAVAVPMAVTTSILTLRMPRIYQAHAEITIEPPQPNPFLQGLIAHDVGGHDSASQVNYVPNQIELLKSQNLAEVVVADPTIAQELAAFDDPAQELIRGALQVRPHGRNTNRVTVLLEGRDPARTKKLLEILLGKFKEQADDENDRRMEATKEYAAERLHEMEKRLSDIDQEMYKKLKTARVIGPGGRNIFEFQYINLENTIAHRQAQLDELNERLMIERAFPRASFGPREQSREQELAVLETQRKRYIQLLERTRRTVNPRRFDSDPAVIDFAERLKQIQDEINELTSIKTDMADDPTKMILEQHERQNENDRAQLQGVLTQMQDSMPEHQQFLSMIEERKLTRFKIAEMQTRIESFEFLKRSQNDPVVIPASVVEPTVPVRPSRTLYIGMGLILSLGLGIGLVVFLEHLDHSVKVPEHVTHGLTLPLLGVVPRIRRTALTHRAGHLWTPGTPDSLESDAFRNIRASLLGVTDRRGPIVTLLVTSPKAGDGKSTTALNLAATCARAGERTLLVDIDLRRPTLADVFPPEPGKEDTRHGVVEVLQGILPWQKTLRHTELRNLDFMATGDPREVPIEVLGTRELRQLLTALANHYDRVILDGPAVLGMADCRMLGRMVDASILVVRAGAHELITLQRSKAMLEQSHVLIAGVIVNSLKEDLQNWSSYGYDGTSMALPMTMRRTGETDGSLNRDQRREEAFC